MTHTQKTKTIAILSALCAIGLWACDGGPEGQVYGADTTTGAAGGSGGSAGTPSKAAVGDSCHSGDTSRYCLALKYVVFKDSSGTPAMSQADAIADVKKTNELWNQCGIAFQIDDYQEVSPSQAGVAATPATMDDLDNIRHSFLDDVTLLVTTTVGSWGLSANAWTAMPGSTPYGAIIEGSVATYGPIIGHELGHYLNLDHVSDESNLMNPVIYPTSTVLTQAQCSQARSAIESFWSKMLR